MKWPYLENEMFTLVLLITALTETFWRVKELIVTKKIKAVKKYVARMHKIYEAAVPVFN